MMKNATLGQKVSKTGTALRRYVDVLGALLRFEHESRLHAPMESILALLEPVILVASLATIVWLMERRSPLHTDPVLHLATGFFPIYFFVYVSLRMRGAINPHQRRFPVEERLDHIIVHVLLRIIDYVILGILGFGFLYVFVSPDAWPKSFKPIFLALVSCTMLGFGWGLVNMVISKKFKAWLRIVPAINRLFVVFSGVFFIPDFLPPTARYILSFNPLMDVVTLFRLGFFPYYPTLNLNTRYLALFCVFAVASGLVLERVSRRREEQ